MNILLVEDEYRVAGFIQRGLTAEGWFVTHARSGEEALELTRTESFDIVLLDLLLPGIHGTEVCRQLRARDFATPILMLTALDSAEEKVSGLRSGADDYLAKPFDFEELIARVEALMRRSSSFQSTVNETQLSSGAICFDKKAFRVTVNGTEVSLSKKERELLLYFMSNIGRAISRERILNAVWGVAEDPLTNIVDVYVARLRRKIGTEGTRILTVRQVGYRMV